MQEITTKFIKLPKIKSIDSMVKLTRQSHDWLREVFKKSKVQPFSKLGGVSDVQFMEIIGLKVLFIRGLYTYDVSDQGGGEGSSNDDKR